MNIGFYSSTYWPSPLRLIFSQNTNHDDLDIGDYNYQFLFETTYSWNHLKTKCCIKPSTHCQSLEDPTQSHHANISFPVEFCTES